MLETTRSRELTVAQYLASPDDRTVVSRSNGVAAMPSTRNYDSLVGDHGRLLTLPRFIAAALWKRSMLLSKCCKQVTDEDFGETLRRQHIEAHGL